MNAEMEQINAAWMRDVLTHMALMTVAAIQVSMVTVCHVLI